MTEHVPAKGGLCRPGRPKQLSDEERRRLLIDAAEHVFLEKGYYAAKIDDIACRAGMSKKTIYQVFAAKEALFEALLSDRFAVLTLPVEQDDREPAAALEDLLLTVALFALSPRQISLTRLLIAEAQRSPEMARALQRQGLSRGEGTLEKWFALQAALGTLKIDDPVEAAHMIFGLAFGHLHLFMLMNAKSIPTRAEIKARVRTAVALFLRGLG
jgi:TetR/AcrR family transcriptional regulator of autoinduction and epiphytic fitness